MYYYYVSINIGTLLLSSPVISILSLKNVQFRITCYIELPYLFSLSHSAIVSQISLIFLKMAAHLFCRMPFSMGLFDVTSWFRLCLFVRDVADVILCSFHCIFLGGTQVWHITANLHVDRLMKVAPSRLLHRRITHSPFVINEYFEGSSFETM